MAINSHANAVRIQQPKCLNDFALLPASRQRLESILDGTLSFPAHGVCGVLLHGLHGTGKTTIAKLLPGLIETAKTDPEAQNKSSGNLIDTKDPYFSYHECMQGQSGVSLINTIQSATSLVPFNTSGFHYVILDEADQLTDAAKASFKALMNRTYVIFLMTTNHLSAIDPGVQNRSVVINMNAPPATQWRPILRRVYTNSGLHVPSDAVLDQVVEAGRGSARSIFSDVVMSANQARRSGLSAVSKETDALC
jgi:DNA polymerase III delta prime subunit